MSYDFSKTVAIIEGFVVVGGYTMSSEVSGVSTFGSYDMFLWKLAQSIFIDVLYF